MPDDLGPGGRGVGPPGPDRIRFIGESYRLLFEKNPLPMWVFDLKTQRFLAVNEAAVRHYGYTREEFLRLTIRDLRPSEDLAAMDRQLENIDSNSESFGIFRHRTKDGSLIHVEVLTNEIDFNNHRARLVLAHDITDRMWLERSLRTGYAVTGVLQSAATFHQAVPQILRSICEEAGWEYGELWRLDPASGRLRWDGAWRIPGFPSEELERTSGTVRVQRGVGIPGTTWATGRPEWLTDLTAHSQFSRVEAAARLRIKQALSFPITAHASRVLGVMVFFSRSQEDPDEAFLDLMRDLGNRMGQFLEAEQLEEDRGRLEERFSKAFYRTPLPGIISRLDGSAIIDVNDSFVRTFGYRRDELVGKTPREVNILQPFDRRSDLLAPLAKGEEVRGVEAVLRTKSGELRTGLLWSERVDMAAEPTILTIIEDVTELRAAQTRLLESERLASIGRTASFVAHELNTPLTNIALLTASLRRQVRDPPAVERLERIDAQRRIASKIIEEVLSFTRSTDLRRETTDLGTLLRLAADQAVSYKGEGVALELDLGSSSVEASVDPLKMAQVFVNLLKNAFQATPRGTVRVSLQRESGAAVIRVRDTGTGMTDAERERLFTAFFTTKAGGEGVGLGLTFSKAVLDAHGGQIEVATEPGRGSTFTVRVPLDEAAPDPAKGAP